MARDTHSARTALVCATGTRGAGAVFSSSGSEADDPLGPEAEEEEYVLDTFVDDDSSALAVDHMIGQYRSFVEV